VRATEKRRLDSFQTEGDGVLQSKTATVRCEINKPTFFDTPLYIRGDYVVPESDNILVPMLWCVNAWCLASIWYPLHGENKNQKRNKSKRAQYLLRNSSAEMLYIEACFFFSLEGTQESSCRRTHQICWKIHTKPLLFSLNCNPYVSML
jgi:hypothetical protein